MTNKYGDQSHFLPIPKGQVEIDMATGTVRSKGGTKGHCVINTSDDGRNPPTTDYHYPYYGQVNRKP